MTWIIPETHEDLVNKPVVVSLTTVMPDGQPQSTPIWWDGDGEHILVNTAKGRQKDRNMKRDSKVTLLAIDPSNPYRWLEVRGVVEDVIEAGPATDHISKMAKKYVGKDEYYGGVAPVEQKDKEIRVLFKVKPTKVNYSPR
jgi:PPOX class probable F420-dependent enzyme